MPDTEYFKKLLNSRDAKNNVVLLFAGGMMKVQPPVFEHYEPEFEHCKSCTLRFSCYLDKHPRFIDPSCMEGPE